MKVVLIVIAVLLLLGLVGFFFASYGLSDIRKMVVREVDLSKVPDGVYTGRFHKARWTYEVEVTVKDSRIEKIRTLNKQPNDDMQKLADGAAAAIVEKQSLRIDAVSGASINTKAYCKAVEDALEKGENRK